MMHLIKAFQQPGKMYTISATRAALRDIWIMARRAYFVRETALEARLLKTNL